MHLPPLPRPRLLAQLDALFAPPTGSVWLAAGAGMGKTTLARQWQHDGGPWLHADEANGCAAGMLQRLHGSGRPALWREQLAAPAAALRAAWREAWAALPAGARVVIDDLHTASDDAALATWLPTALDECPHGVQVLLLSRRPPPPALARLLLAGRVGLLPATALAFTADELAAWQPGAPAGWGRWPAALSAAVPESERESLLQHLVRHELLADTPAEDRRLLAALAWLPGPVTDGDAEALAGAGAAARLAALAGQGLLVDRTPQGHVLHELLAEALREPGAPWQRTLDHLQGTGREDDAIVTALRGCRAGLGSAPLAALLAEAAPRWLAACRHRALADACQAVPEAERPAPVWAALAAALAPIDPRAGRDAAVQALACATPEQAPLRRAALVQIIASYFQTFDRTEPLADWLQQLQALPGEPDDATAVAAYSALFLRDPGHPALPAWEARVAPLPARAADPNLRLRATMLLAKQAWYTGRHAALALLPAQAQAALGAPGRSPYAALLWGLARQYRAWAMADPAAGRAASAQALAEAATSGIHGLDRHLRLHDACFARLLGDDAGARSQLDTATAGADAGRRMEAWHLFSVQAWFALEDGAFALAAEAARPAIDAGLAMGPAPQAMSWAIAAQVALATGADAGPALAALRKVAERTANPRAALFADWLEAAAAFGRGDTGAALPPLAAALAAMQRHGQGLWFGLHRAPAAQLAALALTHGVQAEAARRLVREHRLAPPPDADARWPWDVHIADAGHPELLAIEVDGAPVALGAKMPRRPLELLQTLIDCGGRAPAARLADRLWPEAEGDRAMDAFEVALRRLRSLLRHADALVLAGGTLQLNPARVWVEAARTRSER